MHFQALLLSLIILSFLATGINSPKKSSAEESLIFIEPEETPVVFMEKKSVDVSPSLFAKEINSVLKEKGLVFEEKMTLAGYDLTQKINQNADFLNQAAFVNLNNFIFKLSSWFKKNSSDDKNEEESVALIPEEKKVLPLLICDSEFPRLMVKAALIKVLSSSTEEDLEQVIFEFNPESRWPIASLTKLMTSIIAVEKIGLEKEISMSAKAIATEGASGGFGVGEIYKTSDLIKAMLISSSNDAAASVIESFGEKEFIDEMQKKAAELQMFQTSFLEPTGLSFINQSTIKDLVKLMDYVRVSHFELLEISRQKEAEVFDLRLKKSRKILTVNRFAGQPDFVGGKTGYIEESGRNLMALFNVNGRTVLSIVLGAEDSFKETEKIKNFIQKCTLPTPF